MGLSIGIDHRALRIIPHAAAPHHMGAIRNDEFNLAARGIENRLHVRDRMVDKLPIVIAVTEGDCGAGQAVLVFFLR